MRDALFFLGQTLGCGGAEPASAEHRRARTDGVHVHVQSGRAFECSPCTHDKSEPYLSSVSKSVR